MKNTVYGYCRISTMKQKLQRQIDNIKREYPDAVIITEEFTGTTLDRPKWNKLVKNLHEGDTVVFDEVSRMSRNAEEGFQTYTELFQKGVELVFLKEPHINTSVYKSALETKIEGVGNEIADIYIEATNRVLQVLQRQQIELAFTSAQQEVDYLHQRTSEGVRRAQAAGRQVGRASGTQIETKKAQAAKELIRKHSRDFNGTLTDAEVIKLAGISRNSYYKYKAEIR